MAKDEYNPCKLITWIREHPWVNVFFKQPFDNLGIVIIVEYGRVSRSETIDMKSFYSEDDLIDTLNALYHKILIEEPQIGSCIVENGTNRFNWTIRS